MCRNLIIYFIILYGTSSVKLKNGFLITTEAKCRAVILKVTVMEVLLSGQTTTITIKTLATTKSTSPNTSPLLVCSAYSKKIAQGQHVFYLTLVAM